MPELFGNDFDYWVGKANYVEQPLDFIWGYITDSHLGLDSVLVFERELNQTFRTDQKYCYEQRGQQTVRVYCEAYARAYANRLDGMQERRMRASILAVGNIWYSAWVDAGQPVLKELPPVVPTEQEIEEQKELDAKFQEGKIKGVSCE